MKTKHLLLIGSFLFSFLPTFSQSNTLDGIDKIINQILKDWNVPGVGVGVVKDGEVILSKGYGKRNVNEDLPVDENTLFAIGSCTKGFTAASVAQAVDEGLVDFDKPVKYYLPNFKMKEDYVTDHITLRDMLCHRSGLPRHDLVWYGSKASREDLLNSLEYLEATSEFRTAWQYQNLMFMTAGYVVGHEANMSWEGYIKNRFLSLLGMNSSNFSVKKSQQTKNFALPYNLEKDKLIEIPFRNIDAIGPAGSINSNVVDMCNWLKFQLNKGAFNEETIISETNFMQMHQPQMTMPGNIDSDEEFFRSYGMGWMLTSYRGHFRSEHGGNIDGFSANVGLLPRNGIGVVIMTNMNGTPVPSIIRNIIFDKLLELDEIDWNDRLLSNRNKGKELQKELEDSQDDPLQKKNTSPSHAITEYVGTYKHPAYGEMSLKAIDNKIGLTFRGETMMLSHYHYDIYKVDDDESVLNDLKLNFISSDDGDIDKIAIRLQQGVEKIIFEKTVNINILDMNLYIGEFELLGQAVTFSLDDNDVLKLNVPPQPIYEMVAKGEHTFSIKGVDGFTIVFEIKNSKPAQSVTFHQPNGTFTAKRK